ncbi:hypothetical protein HDU85_007620 [Gaertneriomyces sp. JEL0708]|nr:hypothetical protein HDU85_007620 [Gaertneriomyces sp. JEL0708]
MQTIDQQINPTMEAMSTTEGTEQNIAPLTMTNLKCHTELMLFTEEAKMEFIYEYVRRQSELVCHKLAACDEPVPQTPDAETSSNKEKKIFLMKDRTGLTPHRGTKVSRPVQAASSAGIGSSISPIRACRAPNKPLSVVTVLPPVAKNGVTASGGEGMTGTKTKGSSPMADPSGNARKKQKGDGTKRGHATRVKGSHDEELTWPLREKENNTRGRKCKNKEKPKKHTVRKANLATKVMEDFEPFSFMKGRLSMKPSRPGMFGRGIQSQERHGITKTQRSLTSSFAPISTPNVQDENTFHKNGNFSSAPTGTAANPGESHSKDEAVAAGSTNATKPSRPKGHGKRPQCSHANKSPTPDVTHPHDVTANGEPSVHSLPDIVERPTSRHALVHGDATEQVIYKTEPLGNPVKSLPDISPQTPPVKVTAESLLSGVKWPRHLDPDPLHLRAPDPPVPVAGSYFESSMPETLQQSQQSWYLESRNSEDGYHDLKPTCDGRFMNHSFSLSEPAASSNPMYRPGLYDGASASWFANQQSPEDCEEVAMATYENQECVYPNRPTCLATLADEAWSQQTSEATRYHGTFAPATMPEFHPLMFNLESQDHEKLGSITPSEPSESWEPLAQFASTVQGIPVDESVMFDAEPGLPLFTYKRHRLH